MICPRRVSFAVISRRVEGGGLGLPCGTRCRVTRNEGGNGGFQEGRREIVGGSDIEWVVLQYCCVPCM